MRKRDNRTPRRTRTGEEARRGREAARAGLALEPHRALRSRGRGPSSTTAGRASASSTRSRRRCARSRRARIITTNDSPDISFDQSINPYRGCEHGCIYCYARPTHCYLGHSAGLDFETKLYAKTNAAALLERELANPRYVPKLIALGTNTDPYQPIERERRITRQILEVLERTSHPVGIVTKSALVVRDIDILARMAERGLAKVALSVTTLDRRIARAMEPRAATPPTPSRGGAAVERGRRSDGGDGGADHPGAQRPRDRAHSQGRARTPARAKPATCCCGCRSRSRSCSANGSRRSFRIAPITSSISCSRCTAGATTSPSSGSGRRGAGPMPSRSRMRFRLALKRLGLNERRA